MNIYGEPYNYNKEALGVPVKLTADLSEDPVKRETVAYVYEEVVLKGLLWGNVVGIGLCLLQHYTGWITLNEEGYFLTTVPISMDWHWLLLLDGATFLVIVALLALPTMIISLILPEKTIRFE